jgi:hypothetical protein
MRVLLAAGLLMLSGCGGGSTTGTNYSEPPPMATIVATPTPTPSPSATSASDEASEPAAENAAETNAQ